MNITGKRIRRARERRGWTQRELAREMSLGKMGALQVSFWELGRRLPAAQSLRKLSQALGMSIDDLLRTDDAFCEHGILWEDDCSACRAALDEFMRSPRAKPAETWPAPDFPCERPCGCFDHFHCTDRDKCRFGALPCPRSQESDPATETAP